jgi:hypothetical protein
MFPFGGAKMDEQIDYTETDSPRQGSRAAIVRLQDSGNFVHSGSELTRQRRKIIVHRFRTADLPNGAVFL